MTRCDVAMAQEDKWEAAVRGEIQSPDSADCQGSAGKEVLL